MEITEVADCFDELVEFELLDADCCELTVETVELVVVSVFFPHPVKLIITVAAHNAARILLLFIK